MKKLIVFDGNSIINRAFYGVPLLSTKDGVYTNAVFGFLNILLKYMEEESPDYLAIAFDMRDKTFRHKMYDGYKAGRKGMPDELASQMPLLKEILGAMNISVLELSGYEADDIIGTVSNQCDEKGIRCIIATGDRDSYQLVSENTCVFLPSTRMGKTETQVITPEFIKEKFGVSPSQMIDIKSLMGDSSDNIPGVAGVGEKTAVKLIAEYGSIDGVYENLENIKGSLHTKLESCKELAYLSYSLAEICTKVPLEQSIESFAVKEYDDKKLAELLKKLELNKIMDKLLPNISCETAEILPCPDIIKNSFEAAAAIKEITSLDIFSYYIFKEGSEIVSLSVASKEKSWYFSFSADLLSSFYVDDVKEIFECNTKKITHSLKEDILILKKYDISLKNVVFDTSVAMYLENPLKSRYDIGEYMGFESFEDFFGKGKKAAGPALVPIDSISVYGARLTLSMHTVMKELSALIESRGQNSLYYDMELPLCYVLADMEDHGFKVDKKALAQFGSEISATIDIITQNIYSLAGGEFNINSPRQLGEVLFEKLNLPVVRKTKTGYSTDSDVLDKLAGKHEIVDYIKEFRMLSKLKSTYVDGLIPLIDAHDGKIHSKFNQTVTATGRISSTEPNLQNIPVRTHLGSQIRKMFVATSEEYTLLDADYSQIELRLLAHISGDEVLIDAFKTGKDIHTITASQVFHVEPEQVTPQMRSSAKAVNFGIIYGISDFALAGDLHVSKKTAGEYMEGYLSKYSGVKNYMTDIVEKAKKDGYVTTLFARRRDIPELKSQKFVERSFGERVALNTPIQGSSADIIKLAMVGVYNALKEGGFKSRLILQVHDELIVETHKSERKQVMAILKDCMENVVSLAVPIPADIHEGASWYDAK